MNIKTPLLSAMIILVIAFLFDSCKQEGRDTFKTSGQITGPKGSLGGVTIEINSVTANEKGDNVETASATTDDNGKFEGLQVAAADKYVVNISKQGYAFVSKVYYQPVTNVSVTLTPATVVPANPTQQIDAEDTMARCVDPLDSSAINFKYPFSKVPLVYNAAGELTGFELPPQLQAIYKTLSREKLCASRARVVIPANGLVDENGAVPGGEVEINISTVNLYTPDGMPGDNTVNINGKRGYMISTGAVAIEAYYKNKPLKLNEKTPAKIIIPVDSSRLFNEKQQLERTIPFLVYDRKIGEWRQEGEAILNPEKGVYEKEVTHFSEFNTDFVLTGGTCMRVDASPMGIIDISSGYKLKIIAPIPSMPVGSFDIKEFPLANPGTCVTFPNHHAILRLYENSPIGIILCQDPPGGGPRVYFGNYVVYTESSAASSGAASLPCANYGDCYPKPNGIQISEVLSPKPYLIKLSTTTPTSNALGWAFQYNDATNNQVRIEEAYCNNCPSGSPTFDPYSIVDDIANPSEVAVGKGAYTITPAGATVKYRARVCEDFVAGTCNSGWVDSDELTIN